MGSQIPIARQHLSNSGATWILFIGIHLKNTFHQENYAHPSYNVWRCCIHTQKLVVIYAITAWLYYKTTEGRSMLHYHDYCKVQKNLQTHC